MDSGQGVDVRVHVRKAAAFGIPAAVLVYYALESGSYDIVVRQAEAVVVWLILGLGFALGLLPRARLPRGWFVPFGAFLLFAIWTGLSLTWSDSAERTVAELARVAHFGGIVLLVWSLLDRDTWRAAVAGIAFAGVAVAAIAVASRLSPDLFPANDPRRVFGTQRLNYPFYYWNAVGAWSAITIAMALAWSAHAKLLVTRVLFAGALPICGLAVYLTYSRAGVAGSAIAVLLVVALSHNRWVAAIHALAAAGGTAIVILVTRQQEAIVDASTSADGAGSVLLALIAGCVLVAAAAASTGWLGVDRLRLGRPAGAALAAAGAVVVVAAVLTVGRDEISERWDQFRGASLVRADTGPGTDPASRLTNLQSGRYQIWRSSWRAFESAQLKGVGAGGFEFWWNRDGGEEYVRDAHSIYLENLAELGIPGFLLVLAGLLGCGAIAVAARIRCTDAAEIGAVTAGLAALLVYLVHAGVDWMWESTAVTVLALAAVCAAAAAGAGERVRPAVALRVCVALLAIPALLVQLPGLVATSKVRDSQAAVDRGDASAALAYASEAVDAEPWAASPLVQRALVEEQTGRLAAAAADLRLAAEREPTNWRQAVILARVEAKRGRARVAIREFRRARALRPNARVFDQPPG